MNHILHIKDGISHFDVTTMAVFKEICRSLEVSVFDPAVLPF